MQNVCRYVGENKKNDDEKHLKLVTQGHRHSI